MFQYSNFFITFFFLHFFTVTLSLSDDNQPDNQLNNQPGSQPSTLLDYQSLNQSDNQSSIHSSIQPHIQPNNQTDYQPLIQPDYQLLNQPDNQPANQSSIQPSIEPLIQPDNQPTNQPNNQETNGTNKLPVGKQDDDYNLSSDNYYSKSGYEIYQNKNDADNSFYSDEKQNYGDNYDDGGSDGGDDAAGGGGDIGGEDIGGGSIEDTVFQTAITSQPGETISTGSSIDTTISREIMINITSSLGENQAFPTDTNQASPTDTNQASPTNGNQTLFFEDKQLNPLEKTQTPPLEGYPVERLQKAEFTTTHQLDYNLDVVGSKEEEEGREKGGEGEIEKGEREGGGGERVEGEREGVEGEEGKEGGERGEGEETINSQSTLSTPQKILITTSQNITSQITTSPLANCHHGMSCNDKPPYAIFLMVLGVFVVLLSCILAMYCILKLCSQSHVKPWSKHEQQYSLLTNENDDL